MPLIVYTKNNEASAAIAERMKRLQGLAIEPREVQSDSVLTVPTDFDTDCIVVLSTHRSKAGTPMLTAHFPGNWDKADMGGEARTLNIAHGALLKTIVRELGRANDKHGLGWPVSVEADHHGPTAKVPIIFVEIGSTEKEWKNGTAAMVVAEAVNEAMKRHGDGKPETVFGVGGGHYSREFTEMILKDDSFAVGHICPKYAIDKLDDDTFRQALEKNVDPVKRVLALKDGTNAAQKEKVKKLCGKFGASYEEV